MAYSKKHVNRERSPELAAKVKSFIPKNNGVSIVNSIVVRNEGMIKVVNRGKGLESIYVWTGELMSNREQDQLLILTKEANKIAEFIEQNHDELEKFEIDRGEKIIEKLSNYTSSLNILKMASSINSIRIELDVLDACPYLLQFYTGVVNLLTRELLPPAPRYLFTKKIPTIYAPNAECPLWEKTISEIGGGDPNWVSKIQRIMGSTLGGEMPEYATFFIGKGQNGKTLCMDILQYILGEFVTILPGTALVKKRAGAISNDQFLMKGKRVAICPEIAAGSTLDELFIKSTTGTRTSTSRALYSDFQIVENTAKPITTLNEMPFIKDRSLGTARRLLLVYFNTSFAGKADINLFEKLIKTESSGIANWLIKGYQSFKAKPLEQTDEMKSIINHYMALGDPIETFLNQMIERDPNSSTQTSDLLAAYHHWFNLHPGAIKLTDDMFYKELSARFPAHKGKRSESIYHGLKLKSFEPTEF
ncbi:MAG: hypothetical protein K9M55_07340 [Candidatus Marinimicrobia bacterium]|nr:hypothetical protein [Candidatus Neomarinimicrobiota bacterium]